MTRVNPCFFLTIPFSCHSLLLIYHHTLYWHKFNNLSYPNRKMISCYFAQKVSLHDTSNGWKQLNTSSNEWLDERMMSINTASCVNNELVHYAVLGSGVVKCSETVHNFNTCCVSSHHAPFSSHQGAGSRVPDFRPWNRWVNANVFI